MADGVRLKILNHASLLIRSGPASLLTDPWYFGACFGGYWGLRWDNPDALEEAARAGYVWISHPHNDHFHSPTLSALAQRAPGMTALANSSFHENLAPALREAGFSSVREIPERRELSLAPDFKVLRVPTTSIDNMLFIKTAGLTILDFNDCNLPARALRSLLRRYGKVDVFCASFNHALKLLDYPSDQEVKARFKARFARLLDAGGPRWAIPFASAHYYRAPHSAHQNGSLLSPRELAALGPSVLVLDPGDEADFSDIEAPAVIKGGESVCPAAFEINKPRASVLWEELAAAARGFQERTRSEHVHLAFGLPNLVIDIEDLDKNLALSVYGEGGETKAPAHVAAHSRSVYDWFTRPYGTDVFQIGGAFSVVSADLKPIQRWLLAGTFIEHGLAPKRLLGALLKPEGWKFLLNRREEAWAVLREGKWRVGDRS